MFMADMIHTKQQRYGANQPNPSPDRDLHRTGAKSVGVDRVMLPPRDKLPPPVSCNTQSGWVIFGCTSHRTLQLSVCFGY